jgi:pimeloyl-ACP methyl ester carboxylesterase
MFEPVNKRRLAIRSKVLSIFAFGLLCLCVCAQLVALGADAKLSRGEHFAAVRGIRFQYFVAGSGPLLVVQAPGWGIGSEYLRNGLAPLEAHFTLVFYDTRGSGHSSRPQDEVRMSTSDMVDDLEGLRDYWGRPTMMVLGHSHGGAIAMGYAIRYPDHIKKLILVDSNVQDFDTQKIIQQQLEARRGDKRYEDAIKSVMSDTKLNTDEEFGASLKSYLPLYFYDPDVGCQGCLLAPLGALRATRRQSSITSRGTGREENCRTVRRRSISSRNDFARLTISWAENSR